jgi:hypothetical protein
MVRVQMNGVQGDVWVEAARLQKSPYRHPPFSEAVRDHLRQIKAALDEVYPLSLEAWEDGFRRDQDAEREIATWVHIASLYTSLSSGEPMALPAKRDTFQLLLSCANNPREQVLGVVQLQALTREEAQAVIAAFYGA